MAKLDKAEFTNSGFSSSLVTSTLSANRTLTLPNRTDTIATLSDVGNDVGKGSTSALVPTSPSIGDYWISPAGSNAYADKWHYCTRGGVTDWWSDCVHAETTMRDIYISSQWSFGVNIPIYVADRVFVEHTTFVFTNTSTGTHTTSLFWHVYGGMLNGAGGFVQSAATNLGNSQGLAVNGTRRLESTVGWLVNSTCLRLGVYLLPTGSVRCDFNTVGVTYRIRKPTTLGV